MTVWPEHLPADQVLGSLEPVTYSMAGADRREGIASRTHIREFPEMGTRAHSRWPSGARDQRDHDLRRRSFTLFRVRIDAQPILLC
jgi:hypothetical protein